MNFDNLVKRILESVDVSHQVGGEHWGEMKDSEGNSHYVYVKDVIKKAGKKTIIGGIEVRTK
jgi:hypothetical protein